MKAQYRLGELIMSAPPADRSAALHWLNRAAEGGEKRAAYLLAMCFAKGLGVDRDRAAAYRWMLIARGAGHDRAARQSEQLARTLSPQIVAGINLEAIAFAGTQACKRARRRLRIE
jgi:TPR repeat protein